MFNRIATGWELSKQSFRVLGSDKELVLFPLFSGVACLLVLASFAVPLWSTPWFREVIETKQATHDPFAYLILFAFYVINYFVIVFFNAALVSCALKRMAGENPTVTYGLQQAASRLPQIAAWAVVSATVGVILKMIESKSEWIGKLVASLVGAGWAIATYFVVPILVVEQVGPLEALKRSTSLMRRTWGETLAGKTCLVSGSGNVAQYTVEKLIDLGARPVTLSDSSGFIYDEAGIDREKLQFVFELKNERRGRIKEYAEHFKGVVYASIDPTLGHNPLWSIKAQCAFPSATQNEINEFDAGHLLKSGVYVVSEGANMPTTLDGVKRFLDAGILYAPGKASNAGGVATSGLEMMQNSMRMSWTRQEVDARLHGIMKAVHKACWDTAAAFGTPGNYVNGANIAGFLKVADAMMDQGLV